MAKISKSSEFDTQQSIQEIEANSFLLTADEIDQVLNISEQFQDEIIFDKNLNALSTSSLTNGNLKVFSYNQRKTEHLGNLLANNVYEKLINNLYNDVDVTFTKYIVHKNTSELLKETSDNAILFFNNINSLSKASEISSLNFLELNYSNIVKDFLKTGTSSVIGKITRRANNNLRNIIKNKLNFKEDLRLVNDQAENHAIENTSIIDNIEFQSHFMSINTRIDLLNEDNNNSKFIYNTDKMMSQVHINYMMSEKFLSPNTCNIEQLPLENDILFLEDYPILQIGKRLTNNIDFSDYFTQKGNVKSNIIKKDAKKSIISFLNLEGVQSINNSNNCRYICYENLYNTYYPELLKRINSRDSIIAVDRHSNRRIYDTSLSNTIFLTDCRIKYGSIVNTNRDLTDITIKEELPLEYFIRVGERYRDILSSEEIFDFNSSFITFHDNKCDNEIDFFDPKYVKTRKLPFTNLSSLDLVENLIEEFQSSTVISEIDDLIKSFFDNINSSDVSDPQGDYLHINTELGVKNTFAIQNRISFGYLDTSYLVGFTNINAYDDLNNNIIASLGYLKSVIVFFEKIDRVIETYSINSSRASNLNYSNINDSLDDNSKSKDTIVRQIKNRLKLLSIKVSSAVKAVLDLKNRIRSISGNDANSGVILRISNDINLKIKPYFEHVNSLLKRLFERFVKIENIDEGSSISITEGDFNLKTFLFDFKATDFSNKYYDILNRNISIRSRSVFTDYRNHEDWISSRPADLTSWMTQKKSINRNQETFKNRILSDDLYEEGGIFVIGFRTGSLSCEQQFLWSNNPTGSNYPRVYDYISNSINSLLEGSEIKINPFLNSNQKKLIAGQFRDITYSMSINRYTQVLNSQIDELNDFLDSNLGTGSSDHVKIPVNCILDVHAFKYDESVNKRVNKYLRSNYIEPCENSLSESLKVDFVECLNSIKKEKLKTKDLDIQETLPLSKKLYLRSIDFLKANKDLAFAYGNKDSENILLSFNDEEIKTLIQNNIFTNNYRKDILIDENVIKTTNNLISENLSFEVDFSKTKEDLLKIASYYYANNSFKNNKTLYFRILETINNYVDNHSRNWKRSENNDILDVSNLNFDFDNHPSYYDTENKKYFSNFEYDSFIVKLFSGDTSYDESKEYMKRFVAFTICKETPFENKVTSLSEINICDKSLKTVFDEDVSEIIKINKINNNSKKINEFLFTNKTLSSVLKYNILEFKNPRETYVESNVIFDENMQSEQKNSYYDTLYPLNIWSYKNFSQDKITFISSGYDHEAKNVSFFESFIEDQKFLYKDDSNFSIRDYNEENISLNIPNLDDVNIEKNISIKKLFDLENNVLKSQVNASNIDEEEKNSNFVYKFRTSVKDKFWIGKSYSKAFNESSKTRFEEKETNPKESIVDANSIREYNYDIPGLDMFYYCANSKDMSIIYFFSIILKELLEYYEVDIEQFEDYDQILSFLDENNTLLNSAFNLFKVYCSIFKIVFDRYQSFYIYNFCSILSKENYLNNSRQEYYLQKNLLRLNNSQINNVIETFRMLPDLLKDINRIYTYFIEDEILESNHNNLEMIFNNIDYSLEQFNLSARDIGFKSKDTKILLDLLNTCNINDITKSLNFDIIYGYYKTLSETEAITEELQEETTLALSGLKKYFINKNYNFESCLNDNFYLNIVSKKMQNIFSNNLMLKRDFIDVERSSFENQTFVDYFNNIRKEKIDNIRMTKLIYDKINQTPYIEKDSSTQYNFLTNKTFDFIKIGFKYDLIRNFSENALFKIDIYSFDHDYDSSTGIGTPRFRRAGSEIIKTFYYSPFMTSIPSSFYDDIESETGKFIGFYNKTSKIKDRFMLLTKDEVVNNIKTIASTSGTSEYLDLEVDEYKFAELSEDGNSRYLNKLGEKLFSDHYVSMFCEYYEKFINNIGSQNYYNLEENISERVVLDSFYEEMLNLKNKDFISVFDISKDSFSLSKKGENFRTLIPLNEEIKRKRKSSIFMESLSKNKTDIDLYKILHVDKYYDFFNIMLTAPENKNVSYVLKVEVL